MQQLRRLRYCPATVEAKVKAIQAKIYAAAMYGIEAAEVPPAKVATLTAAVIDAFRSGQEITTIILIVFLPLSLMAGMNSTQSRKSSPDEPCR